MAESDSDLDFKIYKVDESGETPVFLDDLDRKEASDECSSNVENQNDNGQTELPSTTNENSDADADEDAEFGNTERLLVPKIEAQDVSNSIPKSSDSETDTASGCAPRSYSSGTDIASDTVSRPTCSVNQIPAGSDGVSKPSSSGPGTDERSSPQQGTLKLLKQIIQNTDIIEKCISEVDALNTVESPIYPSSTYFSKRMNRNVPVCITDGSKSSKQVHHSVPKAQVEVSASVKPAEPKVTLSRILPKKQLTVTEPPKFLILGPSSSQSSNMFIKSTTRSNVQSVCMQLLPFWSPSVAHVPVPATKALTEVNHPAFKELARTPGTVLLQSTVMTTKHSVPNVPKAKFNLSGSKVQDAARFSCASTFKGISSVGKYGMKAPTRKKRSRKFVSEKTKKAIRDKIKSDEGIEGESSEDRPSEQKKDLNNETSQEPQQICSTDAPASCEDIVKTEKADEDFVDVQTCSDGSQESPDNTQDTVQNESDVSVDYMDWESDPDEDEDTKKKKADSDSSYNPESDEECPKSKRKGKKSDQTVMTDDSDISDDDADNDCSSDSLVKPKIVKPKMKKVKRKYKTGKPKTEGVPYWKLASNKKVGVLSFTPEKIYEMVIEERSATEFICRNCKKEFSNKEEASAHTDDHHPFKCKVCNLKYRAMSFLKNHLNAKHAEKFYCSHCSFISKSERSLKNHITCKHELKDSEPKHDRDGICYVCGQVFMSDEAVNRHMEQFHQLKNSLRVDDFSCPVCNKIFRSSCGFRTHMNDHAGMFKFCPYEGCNFKSSEGYKVTVHCDQVHLGKRLIPCPFEGCPKQAKRRLELQEHLNTVHYKIRHLECVHCGKMFTSRKYLNVHERIHSDTKPLGCDFCDYRCRQRAALNWHMKKQHPDKIEPKKVSTSKDSVSRYRPVLKRGRKPTKKKNKGDNLDTGQGKKRRKSSRKKKTKTSESDNDFDDDYADIFLKHIADSEEIPDTENVL